MKLDPMFHTNRMKAFKTLMCLFLFLGLLTVLLEAVENDDNNINFSIKSSTNIVDT